MSADNWDWDAAPAYLSAAKAEGILSEVRPTKIKSDTLTALNVLFTGNDEDGIDRLGDIFVALQQRGFRM